MDTSIKFNHQYKLLMNYQEPVSISEEGLVELPTHPVASDCWLNEGTPGKPSAHMICAYTRAEALADGVLIDAGTLAREVGIIGPVALTCGAWNRCVKVPPEAHWQDETGRLWDVLWMLACAIRGASPGTSPLTFSVCVVDGPLPAGAPMPEVLLVATIGAGDAGEPVLTVMLPGED